MELEVTRVSPHVALWRMNRPPSNTFGGTLLRDLLEAGREARRNDEIRAVITTGAGEAYAAGADLDKLAALDGASLNTTIHRGLAGAENGLRSDSEVVESLDEHGIGAWVLEWLALEKPLVAAVNGPAAGGGFCLALLHDLRVMAPDAFLIPGFTRLGVAPDMGATWLLPRLVGQARATAMLLLNPRIGAEEGLRTGLVHEIADDPVAAAVNLAERIAAQPPLAVAATLRLLRAAGSATLAEQLTREHRLQQVLWESAAFRAAVDGAREPRSQQ